MFFHKKNDTETASLFRKQDYELVLSISKLILKYFITERSENGRKIFHGINFCDKIFVFTGLLKFLFKSK